MGKAVSISDVARAAKVSTATVSYVLNGRGHVSAETAERVRRTVKELNYQPNAAGRSLATDSARAIGLVAPSATKVSDPFFAMFLAGVLEASRKQRHQLVLLAPAAGFAETEQAIFRAVRGKRVDGVILLEVEPDDVRAQTLVDEGIPLVLFGRTDLPVPWVDVDNHLGGLLATRHLLELGHRRIAHIAAPDRFQYARLRRLGYESALAEWGQGLTPQVLEGDLSVQQGYQLARELLTNGAPPSAIFAGSDVMAEGVMRCALELGIRVPEQLAVVGFDDSPLAQDTFPPLTTVSQNAYQVGERVADLLIGYLQEQTIEQVMVEPELKVRKTTGPVTADVVVPGVGQGIVLKTGLAFSWLSADGTIDPVVGTHGVYRRDTHWVNLYRWLIDGEALRPLTCRVGSQGFQMTYAAKHPDGSCQLVRDFTLFDDHFEDCWTWKCFGSRQEWILESQFAPDFRDIFEIRGMAAVQHSPIASDFGPVERHHYAGRDGVERSVVVLSAPPPDEGSAGRGLWTLGSTAKEGVLTLSVRWQDGSDAGAPSVAAYAWPTVTTNHQTWQQVFDTARADLEMLSTDFGRGSVLAAGLPWYGTFFGRDAIISAYQLLPFVPALAENTLATLAHFQGRQITPEREEMPGKMVHEVRQGELTNLGVLPYGRYYGSVDVTPLFLILLVATWRRTGDDRLLETYASVAEKALAWMEVAGGQEADGLYHFNPKGSGGLTVQSWKDSDDSMVYRDGQRAEPPLAVAEVQGYVYAAKKAMALWYRALGNQGAECRLSQEADRLQQTFHAAFWIPELEYYAMAVDGQGRRLDVLSSDPGQCLWTGIIPDAYRERVVDRLHSSELFSGWGIRTLGASEAAYDPFSYHRGSVWPHDTGLVAAGMAQAGQWEPAFSLARGLLDAAGESPGQHLPELFSGVGRDQVGWPVPYPSACAPQAWAAGSAWLILSVLLGLDIDGQAQVLTLHPIDPAVPAIRVEDIDVPGGRISVEVVGQRWQVLTLPEGWQVRTAKEVVAEGASIPDTPDAVGTK